MIPVCRNTFSSPCSDLPDGFLLLQPYARCQAHQRHPHTICRLLRARCLRSRHCQINAHDIIRVRVCTCARNSSRSYMAEVHKERTRNVSQYYLPAISTTKPRPLTLQNPVVPRRTHRARPPASQDDVLERSLIDQALLVRSLISFSFSRSATLHSSISHFTLPFTSRFSLALVVYAIGVAHLAMIQ